MASLTAVSIVGDVAESRGEESSESLPSGSLVSAAANSIHNDHIRRPSPSVLRRHERRKRQREEGQESGAAATTAATIEASESRDHCSSSIMKRSRSDAPDRALRSFAPRLYRDAVHSVFHFLTLADVTKAALVSSTWLDHTRALRHHPPESEFRCLVPASATGSTLLANLGASSLRHLVSTVQCVRDRTAPTILQAIGAVRHLATLPNLTQVFLRVSEEDEEMANVNSISRLTNSAFPLPPLPPSLASFCVTVGDAFSAAASSSLGGAEDVVAPRHASAVLSTLLRVVSGCRQLTRLKLAHFYRDLPYSMLDLSPILALRHSLTSLTLGIHPTTKQLRVVRQMTKLQRLHIDTTIGLAASSVIPPLCEDEDDSGSASESQPAARVSSDDGFQMLHTIDIRIGCWIPPRCCECAAVDSLR